MGMIDIAGCCPVHLLGGVTGLIAAVMLKPRIGRYDAEGERLTIMANPTNALLGLFMLWLARGVVREGVVSEGCS